MLIASSGWQASDGMHLFPTLKIYIMSSLNFIGGEKGGVGKSVVARVLAQYFIDQGRTFTGYDTDRSHATFSRFYSDFASRVVVDNYEGLDQVVASFDGVAAGEMPSVIVDLAAQTTAPLADWVRDSELFPLMADLGVAVNYWHVADAGRDSVDLLGDILGRFGPGPRYVVVKNLGRGSDFSGLEQSEEMAQALEYGARIVTLEQLQEATMRKIDRQNASFWAALNNPSVVDALGLLERQRLRSWLNRTYASFDALAL